MTRPGFWRPEDKRPAGVRPVGPAAIRAAVVRGLAERYYASVTRYTTSSFMRLKLTRQLPHRDLAPHIYESRQEAMIWLQNHVTRSSAQNRREDPAGAGE